MDLLVGIIVAILILWLLGFIIGVGGFLINILLVIAVIVIIVRLVQGRRIL
ncbi:MAG: lmo0937 family membrane protein [Candidatus Bathyarchaeia archaeon]